VSPRAEVVWTTTNAFVVRLQWRPRDASASEDRDMFQVLRIGDQRIQEIADYRALGEATRAAKRFAAQQSG
jgi:hypothetical protein